MKFWDSSAVIPLCFKEPESGAIQELARADSDIVVWWATRVECVSALSRRLREGFIPSGTELKAKAVLSALSSAWSEVQPTELVRLRAERLLMVHALRAADAFQLAAALTWAQESPVELAVVCLDQALRLAVSREGFTVLP
jgi:uncharacterized protein